MKQTNIDCLHYRLDHICNLHGKQNTAELLSAQVKHTERVGGVTVMFCTRIRAVLGLNLGRVTGYRDLGFL
jgi:hypothetical protein